MSLDKIINTLNLAASNTREETIRSMIENSLYSYGEPIEPKNLQELIKADFGINLFESELFENIETLQNGHFIQLTEGGKFQLTDDRIKNLLKIELELKDQEDKRKSTLCDIFKSQSSQEINSNELDLLIKCFTAYIHECFLEYGKKAITFFAPIKYEVNPISQSEILNSCLKRIENKNLNDLFKKVITNFPLEINSDFLDYLEKLANKTECFYSLGLTKELHNEIVNLKFIDWVVFLDTNFLYSFLNLHHHPETFACKELIKLVNQYKLGIKFTYTNDTKRELLEKRDEFTTQILSTNFTQSQIRALLKSEKLDEFSKSYFENKLLDPENTPHPTEVIDNHIAVLRSQNIQIYQSKFKHIINNDNLINDQISKFRNYERMRNEVRAERKLPLKNEKDLGLLDHDIIMREAIYSLRNFRATNLNEIKYFGLTLDKALIGFDKQEINKSDNPLKVPIFFLPSFLLSKIVKFLPLITDDYKRAFITAISSVAFEQSNKKVSFIAQQSVKKFYKMGITNESLILSCVSQKVFLDEFDTLKNDTDQETFIESTINKKIEALHQERGKLKSQLEYTHDKIRQFKEIESEKNQVIENLIESITEISTLQKMYETELARAKNLLNQKNKIKDASQQELLFSDRPISKENDEKKLTLSINITKLNKAYKRFIEIANYIITGLNIIGFLFIVLTGILLDDYVKSMPIAGLGLTLLLFLLPRLQSKNKAFRLLNLCILIIYVCFVFINWSKLISLFI